MLVTTFSNFSVQDRGRHVAGRLSPKVMELTCYLLMRSPSLVRREQIIDDLFSSGSCGSGRSALNTAIWRIRSWLEDTGLTNKFQVSCDAERTGLVMTKDCTIDAKLLDGATAMTGDLSDGGFRDALRVYTGPFLDGFDSPWIVCERTRLQSVYIDLLKRAVSSAIRCDDLSMATNYCEKILNIDSYQEHVYLVLMASLAGLGQRVSAMQHYSYYERTMRKEMGMEVLPEAKELAQAIFAGKCSRNQAIDYISDQLL